MNIVGPLSLQPAEHRYYSRLSLLYSSKRRGQKRDKITRVFRYPRFVSSLTSPVLKRFWGSQWCYAGYGAEDCKGRTGFSGDDVVVPIFIPSRNLLYFKSRVATVAWQMRMEKSSRYVCNNVGGCGVVLGVVW